MRPRLSLAIIVLFLRALRKAIDMFLPWRESHWHVSTTKRKPLTCFYHEERAIAYFYHEEKAIHMLLPWGKSHCIFQPWRESHWHVSTMKRKPLYVSTMKRKPLYVSTTTKRRPLTCFYQEENDIDMFLPWRESHLHVSTMKKSYWHVSPLVESHNWITIILPNYGKPNLNWVTEGWRGHKGTGLALTYFYSKAR